jgi:hypothetical protein
MILTTYILIVQKTLAKDQSYAFLGGSFAPPGLDEDGIATMSVATLLAIEDDGTCKAPNRLVYSLNVGTTIDTRESNNTHTR